MWGSSSIPPINLQTLHRPIKAGGLGLLDIQSRNEAIDLVWLRRYLTLGEDRPTWAFAMDAIIGKHATRDAGAIRPNAQINMFLQSWNPSVSSRSTLPLYIKNMLTTGRRYGVHLEALKVDGPLKKQLPAWYHIGATKALRKLNNTKVSDCLRDRHGVSLVADLLKLTHFACGNMHPQSPHYSGGDSCPCPDCSQCRREGCAHPAKCRQAAFRLLSEILPKWNPLADDIVDGLTLTTRRRAKNLEANFDDGDTLTFDPSITTRGGLTELFRAFVNPSSLTQPPSHRRRPGRAVPDESTTVY
ncbi:uncharacterized protein B0H18DRAFT_881390, partial [Fomitopsis serialis]|uniref:uncharacterized protein n=1 Tax=Fomitopsis serialis TaxID=139415 RepID=UPI002008D05B